MLRLGVLRHLRDEKSTLSLLDGLIHGSQEFRVQMRQTEYRVFGHSWDSGVLDRYGFDLVNKSNRRT